MFSKSPAIVSLFLVSVLLLTGLLGVLVFCALLMAERSGVVLDSSKKHGISHARLSRLGGVAIFVSLIVYILIAQGLDEELSTYIRSLQSEQIAGYAFLALVVSLIGLADDLNEGLSPGFRMLLLSGIVLFALSLNQEWLPVKLFHHDLGLANLPMFVIVPVTSFVLIGFINAGNMIDGANGLLSGVSLMWFIVLFDLQGSYYFFLLALALLAFTLHNLFFSSVILGDFGSFGLSSLIILSSFQVFEANVVSIWFFSAILSYPCFEIVRVILIRLKPGRSPFIADNQHLHNSLFRFLLTKRLNPEAANSLTGAGLAFISSLTPFSLYFFGAPLRDDTLWLIVSLAQYVVLACLWLALRNIRDLQH